MAYKILHQKEATREPITRMIFLSNLGSTFYFS